MKVFTSWRCVVEEDNKLLEAFADNIKISREIMENVMSQAH